MVLKSKHLRLFSTNRTIVELKPLKLISMIKVNHYQSYHSGIETKFRRIYFKNEFTTNRTIVELKLMNCMGTPAIKRFYQSYHSGIETRISLVNRPLNVNYQSYHSGIETCFTVFHGLCYACLPIVP